MVWRKSDACCERTLSLEARRPDRKEYRIEIDRSTNEEDFGVQEQLGELKNGTDSPIAAPKMLVDVSGEASSRVKMASS